jgi:RNA polymerase sigma factor (sigma-70 family)
LKQIILYKYNIKKQIMKNLTAKEFERLRKMMMRVAKQYLRSDIDSEEVVGRVIEKLAEGKFNAYSEEVLEPVLKKAVRFGAIDFTRSRRYKMHNEGKMISMDNTHIQFCNSEDAEGNVLHEANLVLLEKEISKLKPEEAILVKMKYMEGNSYEEIATVLGGNAKSLCVKAGRVLNKLENKMCF